MMTLDTLIKVLADNDCSPYFVGGCVRDKLLGRTPNDYDITVKTEPQKTAEILQNAGETVGLDGVRYGTVTVETDHGTVEITTHRKDGEYTDSRRPDEVEFTTDVRDDLRRRDFTVNAMAESPNGEITDPFDGQKDLQDKCIRAVGDPVIRFTEDALRMLRCIRFAAKLGFEIEPKTWAALTALHERAAVLSDSRVGYEIAGILLSDHPEIGMKLLRESGLSDLLFPGYRDPEELEKLPSLSKDLTTRLSYLLFNQTTSSVYAFLRRIATPKKLFDDVLLITTAESIQLVPDPPYARRLIRTYGDLILTVLEVRSAFGEDLSGLMTICRTELANHACVSIANLAITGDDLITAGVPAGRAIGITLSYLLDRVMDDPTLNEKHKLLPLGIDYCAAEGYIF